MDIQHTVNATAVITLGKDMTFRDFAQGAFRMRGIGKGQKLDVFVVPEIRKLVCTQLKAAKMKEPSTILKQLMPDGSVAVMPLTINLNVGATTTSTPASSPTAAAGASTITTTITTTIAAAPSPSSPSTTTTSSTTGEASTDSTAASAPLDPLLVSSVPLPSDLTQVLRDISSWLLIQTCLAESVQFNMLTEQNLANVARKVCFKTLLESYTDIGTSRSSEALHGALEVFRERMDYQVEDKIPVNVAFISKLRMMVKRNHSYLLHASDQSIIKHVLNLLTQSQVKLGLDEATSLLNDASSKSLTDASMKDPSLALQDVTEVDPQKTNMLGAEQQQEQEQEQGQLTT